MLEQSRLTNNQCSLFDTRPIPQSLSISSSYYPDAAQRWRFEGYVEEAFDIAADGRVQNTRAVMVYPPYIFEETTDRAALNFRYIPPRLGGEVVGCEGRTQKINFKMP